MHSLLSHFPLLALNVLPFHTHSFLPWPIPTHLICSSSKSDTPIYILRTLFLEHFTTHSNCTPVYTDGSKSQYGSGFAILFPSQYFQFQLPTISSVLMTELYTILFALRKFLSYPSSSFVIFTDSKFCLSSMLPLYYSPFKEIQEWLFHLYAHKKSICFCWVQSHAGITGNERVDSLPYSTTILGCHRFTKVQTYDYFHSFCSFLFSRWQSFWSDLSNNKLCAVKPSISSRSDPYQKN